MKLLIAIISIAIIALIGSRFSFQARRFPLGFRTIFLTGTEYIFLGLLLGIHGLNVLDQSTIAHLRPALLFCLCWIGFLFGLQFGVKHMRNLPRYYFSITGLQSIITFTFVSLALYVVLTHVVPLDRQTLLVMALVLGSTSCCTAQTSLAIVAQGRRFKNRELLELLRYISSVDGLWGLLFFTLSLGIMAGFEQGVLSLSSSATWFFSTLFSGIFPALFLIVFLEKHLTQQELYVFLMGTIMFSAGTAEIFHNSPLVSGMLGGLVVANLSRQRLRALSVVIHAEKSIYIFLLLLIGASWKLSLGSGLLVMLFYFTIRLIGKLVGVYGATRLIRPIYHVPPFLGLGLIPEGGLAIAMVISFTSSFELSAAGMLETIIILSVLLSELLGPAFITNVLKKE